MCEYVDGSDEWMLKAVSDLGMLSEVETLEQYRKRVYDERKASLMGKALHGKFFSSVSGVAHERSWQWVRSGYI